MRLRRWIGGLGLATAGVVGGSAFPVGAAGPPAMPWMSPPKIPNGVPVEVSSLPPFPCPPVPTPGDTALVQVTLSFGAEGAGAQILPVNPDGSWSGDVTFGYSDVGIRQTTISAECLDFTGFSATPYAQYQVRHTQLTG